MRRIVLAVLILAARTSPAAEPPSFDAAAAFGARPGVTGLTVSPDGQSVAWIAADARSGAKLYTLSLASESKAHVALYLTGKPERLDSCSWVSNDRLVCTVDWLRKDPGVGILPFSRSLAVNTDGSNVQLLGTRSNSYSRGITLSDGQILDWLPDLDGSVLMARDHRPDLHTGSLIGSDEEGLGVDEVDTRTLKSRRIEKPRRDAWQYISDGRGHVRIVGLGRRSVTCTTRSIRRITSCWVPGISRASGGFARRPWSRISISPTASGSSTGGWPCTRWLSTRDCRSSCATPIPTSMS
jgi:hypothetical protein